MIFANPPFGIEFKGNLRTYNRTPDAVSYIEVQKEDCPISIRDLVKWSFDNIKVSGSMWLISR